MTLMIIRPMLPQATVASPATAKVGAVSQFQFVQGISAWLHQCRHAPNLRQDYTSDVHYRRRISRRSGSPDRIDPLSTTSSTKQGWYEIPLDRADPYFPLAQPHFWPQVVQIPCVKWTGGSTPRMNTRFP